MFYATSKAAVYSAAPVGINPDENIALIKLRKLIRKRSGGKPLSMGCQATQRNSSVNITITIDYIIVNAVIRFIIIVI